MGGTLYGSIGNRLIARLDLDDNWTISMKCDLTGEVPNPALLGHLGGSLHGLGSVGSTLYGYSSQMASRYYSTAGLI